MTPGDLDGLEVLYRGWETAYAMPYRTSRDELRHWMDDPNVDLDRHTRVGVGPDGSLVSCAWVFATARSEIKHRAILMTVVLPEHADGERSLIRWGVAAAERRFAEHADELERVVRTYAEAHETRRIAAFESEGFEVVRYFVDMIRPLDVPIPDPVLPGGLQLVPWHERWTESAHEAHCEAFADHWGSLPPTLDDWRHWVEAPNFRPDLSFVVVGDGAVLAYSLNGVYPEDYEVRGRHEGWIDTLGTRRDWRRRGLASALINASMRSFAEADLDHAALGVDAASPTGAFGLYESLGFVEHSRSVSLVKQIAAT